MCCLPVLPSLLPLLELEGIYRREMVEMLFVGCVLCVLSVGAKWKGWLVCLGWGRIAGCHECVLCSVTYCTRALVV